MYQLISWDFVIQGFLLISNSFVFYMFPFMFLLCSYWFIFFKLQVRRFPRKETRLIIYRNEYA